MKIKYRNEDGIMQIKSVDDRFDPEYLVVKEGDHAYIECFYYTWGDLSTKKRTVIFRTFSLTLEATEELMKRIGHAIEQKQDFCDFTGQYSEGEPQLIDT